MTLSATAIAEAFKEDSSVAWLILLTITHDDLAEPIRCVNSRGDVMSNGETFIAFPFSIVLPGEDGETMPRARLRIDNVSREVYSAIWALDPAPYVQVDVVLSSDPNTIEYTVGGMRLERVEADDLYLTGELTVSNIGIEPYPGDSFSPSKFPSLF